MPSIQTAYEAAQSRVSPCRYTLTFFRFSVSAFPTYVLYEWRNVDVNKIIPGQSRQLGALKALILHSI